MRRLAILAVAGTVAVSGAAPAAAPAAANAPASSIAKCKKKRGKAKLKCIKNARGH